MTIKISESNLRKILNTFLAFFREKEEVKKEVVDNIVILARVYGEENADCIGKIQG